MAYKSTFKMVAFYARINEFNSCILPALFYFVQVNCGVSQNASNYDHYSIEDGLPCMVVEDMTQDKSGILWLGMEEGLTKFDGYEFKTYSHHPFPGKESPNAPHIMTLVQDKEGFIWLGTFGNGINKFDPITETFEYFVYAKEDQNSLSNNYINDLSIDEKGVIWGATNYGLNSIDPQSGKIKRYFIQKGRDQDVETSFITSLLVQNNGTILAGTINGHLLSVNSLGEERDLTKELGLDLLNYRITEIIQSGKNEYWIATAGGGVFIIDENYRITGRINTSGNPEIAENMIKALLRDASGALWIGTSQNLYLYDVRTRICKPYYDNTKFPDQNIYNIRFLFQDRSGVVWVGTELKGLYFIRKKKFANPINFNIHARCFFQSEKEKLLIGSEGSGLWKVLACCGESTQQISRVKSSGFNPKSVHCLVKDNAGYFWVGTNDQGLFRLSLDEDYNIIGSRQFRYNALDSFSLVNNYIWTLYLDAGNRLWVGTKGGFSVLDLADPENGRFINFEYTPNNDFGLLNNEIRCFLVDDQNRMWISTRGGVNRFSVPADFKNLRPDLIKMDQFTHNEQDLSSISSNSLLTILLSKKGELWFGTGGGGVCKYVPEHNSFLHYSTREGFSNNMIYAILEDDEGNLWTSSNLGISFFDPVKKIVTNYSPEEGLQGFEYTGLSALKGPGGELYFGGINGFDRFLPKHVRSTPPGLPPSIAFTKFVIFDNEYARDRNSDNAKKNIADKDKVSLHYNQNTFSIQFAALDFNSPSKNKYKYRLEHYDHDWVSSNAQFRTAIYTKVPPGKYTFRVKASNPEGVWNEEGISFELIIHPPWWRTNLAYAFYLITAGMMVFTFFRYQRQRWQLKAELDWEKKEAYRLKELDEFKNRLYTNITHEFRTPLTVISGMSDKIKESPDEWLDQGINMIRRNSFHLLDLVNQILDLKKLESGAAKVSMIQGNIVPYLAYISESFDSQAKSRGIALHFLPDIPEIVMDFDKEKILRIVSNLLSNAIKFTPPGGHIYLELKKPENQENRFLQIVVRDTGQGIPADKLPFVFDRFYQVDDSPSRSAEGTGIGLTLTREVVRLLGGEISAESTVGRGSLFTVRIPIRQEAPFEATLPDMNLPDHEADSSQFTAFETSGNPDKPFLLIVEDNPDVTQYLKVCLESDYQVLFASNGVEGIEKAIEWVPDIIISDVMMPGKDGFELCKTLKNDERTSHIPIILLTAKADSDSVLEGLERGADAYLAKPFDEKELRVRLRKLVELRKKLQARYGSMDVLTPTQDPGLRMEDGFLTKARATVESRLDDPNLSLHDLCQELGVSRTQLHNKLKALTGRSASSFIRIIRLQKGKELLNTTRLNVSEVSFEVGFNDPNYFSRCYFEEFGERPSQSRNI